MKKKINFMYENERLSFLNKNFTIIYVLFVLLLMGIITIISNKTVMLEMIGVIVLTGLIFGYKTYKFLKAKNFYKKHGKKCTGVIVGVSADNNCSCVNDDFEIYDKIYLVVEYNNPFTNCAARTVSKAVHGNPYSHLASLKVVVYVLEDGRAYITKFKRIKNEKDAIKYHDDELKQYLKEGK